MSNIKSEIDKWYENYIDELFAYGIAFGVEKDFVLDAIHDLFLHLFESADKIEILGSPKSYLFSALKNKIITSLRKQAIITGIILSDQDRNLTSGDLLQSNRLLLFIRQ